MKEGRKGWEGRTEGREMKEGRKGWDGSKDGRKRGRKERQAREMEEQKEGKRERM